ncbi:MAG: FAD-dependent oxidoreductase [Verrucomicrobiota bacterium]
MTERDTDFLIVGGGLAGLLLAWRLRSHSVLVLGGKSASPASHVAAGVLNPITGSRLTLMEEFDDFLHCAREIYKDVGQREVLYRDCSIRRYFQSEEEIKWFANRQQKGAYRNHLSERLLPGHDGPAREDLFGSFFIQGVGLVEPSTVVQRIRSSLGPRIFNLDANWDSLSLQKDGVELNHVRAKTLICCEGYSVLSNPLFRWLPFRPAYGETLTVECPTVPSFDEIIHHRKWVVSLGSHRFRIGSTWESPKNRKEGIDGPFSIPPPIPTDSGKQELLEAFRLIFGLNDDPEVVDHRSGVRPCSRDRQPYLGPHPRHENVFICNGLGSKGTVYAPLLTRILADHLVGSGSLERKYLPERMLKRGFTFP